MCHRLAHAAAPSTLSYRSRNRFPLSARAFTHPLYSRVIRGRSRESAVMTSARATQRAATRRDASRDALPIFEIAKTIRRYPHAVSHYILAPIDSRKRSAVAPKLSPLEGPSGSTLAAITVERSDRTVVSRDSSTGDDGDDDGDDRTRYRR